MSEIFINKILNYSSVDGPGNRLVLFLQGCNLNCLYCHNPETINYCKSCGICIDKCSYQALQKKMDKIIYKNELCRDCDECIKHCPNYSSPKVKKIEMSEVKTIIKKYSDFISGVTLTGGEASLQYEQWADLYDFIKSLNLTLYLDTNGLISEKYLNKISDNIDKAMVDLKSFCEKDHIKLTGKSNKEILRNVVFFNDKDLLYEIRTVVFEGYIDMINNIKLLCEFIMNNDIKVKYKIIRFRTNGVKKQNFITSPSKEFLKKIEEILNNYNMDYCIV